MSENDIKNFTKLLSASNYRVTNARLFTFKLLQSPEPQSMGEILKKAKNKVDRVSVYRSIDLFEKLGIVQRLNIGWKYKIELSDDFVSHHHHLSCLKCGKVIDIDDEKHIDEFIKQIAAKFGFLPRRHQFEIDGYCKECSTIEIK